MAAATKGSTATNSPSHVPIGGSFVNPPQNRAKVTVGSATVKINGRPAARLGDVAETCNHPQDLPVGTVIAVSTVRIGGGDGAPGTLPGTRLALPGYFRLRATPPAPRARQGGAKTG